MIVRFVEFAVVWTDVFFERTSPRNYEIVHLQSNTFNHLFTSSIYFKASPTTSFSLFFFFFSLSPPSGQGLLMQIHTGNVAPTSAIEYFNLDASSVTRVHHTYPLDQLRDVLTQRTTGVEVPVAEPPLLSDIPEDAPGTCVVCWCLLVFVGVCFFGVVWWGFCGICCCYCCFSDS